VTEALKTIVAYIALFMLALMGLRWAWSMEPKGRAEAKKGIVYIIIGLIIVTMFAAIVQQLYTNWINAFTVGGGGGGGGTPGNWVRTNHMPKPTTDPTYTNVQITHYYTCLESDSYPTSQGYSSFSSCVHVEGSGITGTGKVLNYQMQDTGKTHPPWNGVVAYDDANPTVYRTIAVDTSKIELGKTVYVYFGDDKWGDWNGCYRAEDIGSAIVGNHIDLFVGVGDAEYVAAGNLPGSGTLWVMDCQPG